MTWQRSLQCIVGVGLTAAVLSTTSAGPAAAQAALKPLRALIVNTASDPVPVTVAAPLTLAAPVEVTPPLWAGMPFTATKVVLNSAPDGFEFCEDVFKASAGTVVLLGVVTGAFNVPPGGFGRAAIIITNLDQSKVTLDVPMPRTAPIAQIAGLYDQYSGSLDLGGFPVAGVAACVIGVDSALRITLTGYTVPIP